MEGGNERKLADTNPVAARIANVYTISVDVFFQYRGQDFVWDGQKALRNRTKHGVSFETACEVFFDPLSADEDASTPSEERQAVIGMALDRRTLYVVHVIQEGMRIRIISARVATRREMETYEDGV